MVATHTRVSERLTLALQGGNRDGAPPPTGSEYADPAVELKKLRQEFHAFYKKFKPLRTTLKKYYLSLKEVEKDRQQMMQQLEVWTKDTPLEELVMVGTRIPEPQPTLPRSIGQAVPEDDVGIVIPSTNSIAADEPSASGSSIHSDAFVPIMTSTTTGLSLSAITHRIGDSHTTYHQHLHQYALEYVAEWDQVVATRVRKQLKVTDEAKHNFTHYQLKVNNLQQAHVKLEKKGKPIEAKSIDKLTRNQEKLELADKEYRSHVQKACVLLRAVLRCAWKDVHPLVYRLVHMEQDRLVAVVGGGSSDDNNNNNHNNLVPALRAIVAQLQILAKEHDIDTSLPTIASIAATTTMSPPVSPGRVADDSMLTTSFAVDQSMLTSVPSYDGSSSVGSYASSNNKNGRVYHAPSDESSSQEDEKKTNEEFDAAWDDVRDVYQGTDRVVQTRITVSNSQSSVDTEKA